MNRADRRAAARFMRRIPCECSPAGNHGSCSYPTTKCACPRHEYEGAS